jgi:hypothetical protein
MSIVLFFGMVSIVLLISFSYLGAITYKYLELRKEKAQNPTQNKS